MDFNEGVVRSDFANQDVVLNLAPFEDKWRLQATVVGVVIFDGLFDDKESAFDATTQIGIEAREYLDSLT